LEVKNFWDSQDKSEPKARVKLNSLEGVERGVRLPKKVIANGAKLEVWGSTTD
jgi:hypothetical protein